MSRSHMAVDDAGPILFTMDSNTQASPKAKHSPPPLPKRNARRASRFLDALLDSSAPTTATTPTTVTASAISTVSTNSTISTISTISTTPAVANKILKSSPKMTSTAHEVYLSSEEDASSLGDVSDYDDAEEYDYDSDTVEYIGAPVVLQIATTSTASSSSSSSSSPNMPASAPPTSTAAPPLPTTDDVALPARRHSHEDRARLVSVVYAGKPSLVDLAVERAARHRSLNGRANSPSPSTSSASMVSSARSNRSDSSASRPSTSAGSAPSTALSSLNASPQRLQHKRNSSGSMMTSLRARKAMETIADSPSTASKETDMPKPTRAYTTTSSRMPPMNTAVVATTAAAAAAAAPPLSSSPRTPTLGHSNLLRGVTRTLTLNRRGSRLLNKERDAAFATSQPPSTFLSAAPPLPGQLPGVAAPATSDVSMLRRKSLALSVVSLGLGNGGNGSNGSNDKSMPPMPRAPDEHMFTTSIAPALRRASTSSGAFLPSAPAHKVLSKKNGNGAASPSTSSFFSRRRSVKLL